MGECELCFMNPPWEATSVPEALPNDTLCADCREQCDSWDRAAKVHREENHQAPWEYNCEMCSMAAYEEDRAKAWQAHLARCEACQKSPHDFMTAPPPRCRACGAEKGAVGLPSVCTLSYTREIHRDSC